MSSHITSYLNKWLINRHRTLEWLNIKYFLYIPIAEIVVSSFLVIIAGQQMFEILISLLSVFIYCLYTFFILHNEHNIEAITRHDHRSGYFRNLLKYIFANNSNFTQLKQKLIAANYYYLARFQQYKSAEYNEYILKVGRMSNNRNINKLSLSDIQDYRKLNPFYFKITYIIFNVFSLLQTIFVLINGIYFISI